MGRGIKGAEPLVAEYRNFRFDDWLVVNPEDFIPAGDYNPHRVRPWLIYNEYGSLAVVFASHEAEALDVAADKDRLKCCAVSREDAERLSEAEQEELTALGNASELFDLANVNLQELPNPPFSFVALFNARPQPRVKIHGGW